MKAMLFAIVGLVVGGSAAASDAPTPVRVMSFNIRFGTADDGDNHWKKRQEFLAETIRSFDPDLLGTQETLAFQRDYLLNQLPGYEVWAAGRDDGRDRGEMAALYYRTQRFTKLDGGHFWLSPQPAEIGSRGWDAALPRIATWVKLRDRFDSTAPPVFFLNTHFDHRGAQARAESARLIRAKLTELGSGCRLVVTGDFNAAEGSAPYRILFGDADGQPAPIIDTWRTYRPERSTEEGTFSGFKAEQTKGPRIDWIGCSRDWDVRLAGIDRTARAGRTPSDHFPVTAVLRPADARRRRTLRVLSYNLHHGEGMDQKVDLPRIARVIRAADADLVALQEVDRQTKRTNDVDQTLELARLTGMHGQFGKAIDYQGGEYGQAILARFPITDAAVHTLPGEPAGEQRIALAVQMMIDGQRYSFVTTHLHHRNPELRRQQAARLREIFGKIEHPVILAGDFNALPNSPPMQVFQTDWTNATADEKLLTYPAQTPARQIDYVLFRPVDRLRLSGAQVVNEAVASDHRPVLVELEITDSQAK
jgi:endonuclease/exonuclease/phosphatase family metal-dependent hydrolase